VWPKLICPIDSLVLNTHGEEMLCRNGHHWKIVRGIPRIVTNVNKYTYSFGIQWNVYHKTQLDSYTNTTISYDRTKYCLGEKCWEKLQNPEPIHILEIGCGAGRFTEVFLNKSSAYVTSVDLSSAVEANQKNCPQNDRHRIIQADLLRLPFDPQQFDIVFCLGVVQHTPNPEQSIYKLYEQVKPGGWLIFDHYTYNLSSYTKSALLIRQVLKRLSPENGLKCTNRIVEILFPLHRAVRRRRTLQMLLSRISPVISYYHVYTQLNDKLQYEFALLDTHDSLTDWYKHHRTKRQIKRVLQEYDADDIYCEYGGNGVEARCRKPNN